MNGAVVILVLAAVGCANQRLLAEHRARIKNVSIDQNIVMADRATYVGNKESFSAALFLPLAYQFTRGANAERLRQLLVDSHIDVKAIFMDRFTSQLRASQLFNITELAKSDARFSFEIIEYGLGKKSGFSGDMQPCFMVKGCLTTAKDEVIWQHVAFVDSRSSETEAHGGKEYFANPELVRKVLTDAVRIAVKDLIDQITG